MSKSKQERFKEAYEYVRYHNGVHTQSALADILNMTRPAISAAMNGNEAYLTDNLFKRICAAFQGVFNLDYLLTGEGELLANSEQKDGDVTVDGDYMAKYIASLEKQVKDKDQQIADLRRDIQLLYKRLNIESRWGNMQANLMGGIAVDELQEPIKDEAR